MAAYVAVAALLPLALTVVTLAWHLHTAETARRMSAAATLLHHSGKELR